jgi:protein-S-isoprenylcysteine O-methyltransferase Ste14
MSQDARPWIEAAWAVLLVYWVASARWASRPARSEPLGPRLYKYGLPLATVAMLIRPPRGYPSSLLHWRFMPDVAWVAMLGLAMTWAGVLFACRARSVLGAHWGSQVQIEEARELIVRGPHPLVRHPIHTGLLLALLGSALALGELRGLLAFAIVAVSFGVKLRREER